MAENTKWVISGAPHVHGPESVTKIMWGVVIALIPSFLVSVYFFGMQALLLTVVTVLSCLVFEYLINRFFFKRPCCLGDGSAMITGILLALNLPAGLPLWMAIVGSLVAIGIAKWAYGGLGQNPFNPALVGRVFLLISFPAAMTTWKLPHALCKGGFLADAVTGPTPLGIAKEGLAAGQSMGDVMNSLPAYSDLFFGQMAGSMGEISAIAILIGGIYMLCRKIISWHIPVTFLGSAFIFSGILWLCAPDKFMDPVFHLLTGGIMLGAVFMATDMVTSPMTAKGKIIFGIGCGVLTVLIRTFGAYPEGVSFAILIMNAFVPLINRGSTPKRFATSK
ncbi:MAG: RnfABCDGE type electron transport complex subunit D [Bacteroides sp.]|nr:RnfABCDGE type electron transport complex subunit D [Bacteroides sp.]MCM1085026.1 RnfABCDGE type electron transport complex subunit D [Bacteroides sp.]MCM1169989.1 RnfABCDGE type electron transport complex subunit D [Bacteroides sp.]